MWRDGLGCQVALRLSLSLRCTASVTCVWPAWGSVFPHHPAGKTLPRPEAHGLRPHHFGLRFRHISHTVKGLGRTWMRSGVSLDWIQAWFNKVLQTFCLPSSYFFTSLAFVFRAAFFLPQIQRAPVSLNSSHPCPIPKPLFLCPSNVSSLIFL